MLAFVDRINFKNSVEVSSQWKKNQHLWSHEHTYDHKEDHRELWDDNSNGNLVIFIISNFIQIATFAKYFSTQRFSLLQYV